jgi:single-stranded-DNA-specific exonuclease
MTKIWKLRLVDETITEHIVQALKVHPSICRLLTLRGIKDYDSAKFFFRPAITDLHDPFLMKGMDKAVSRIEAALAAKEKIMIYGDYDVDGTTAVAVVYSFLQKTNPDAEILFYVPHRYREGYGVSTQGIEYAVEQGVKLMITLDCGIKSADKIAYAASLGIDVIVCDHHTPDEDNIPAAIAILNPKQADCSFLSF